MNIFIQKFTFSAQGIINEIIFKIKLKGGVDISESGFTCLWLGLYNSICGKAEM